MFDEVVFERLIVGLNRREIDFIETRRAFSKLGREVYDRLFQLLDSSELEKWQIVHILEVLLFLRHIKSKEGVFLADSEKLFEKILSLALHAKKFVRGVAIGVAIQLVEGDFSDAHPKIESATRSRVEPIARKSLELGLQNPYRDAVADFLKKCDDKEPQQGE